MGLELSTLIQVAVVVIAVVIFCICLKIYTIVSCGMFKEETRMDGRTVVITGANSGIGKETAMDLAKRGARVIMACRNLNAANVTRNAIIDATGNKDVFVKKLDLSSQRSIRKFAEDFLMTEDALHVLLHNAGTAQVFKKLKTEDGIETTMAVNYYGVVLLTHLLTDILKRSAPARVVIVTSSFYRVASVNLDNLNPVETLPAYLYFVSKLAVIYYCQELAKRLEGTLVSVNCLHPGMVDTAIWKTAPIPLNLGILCFSKTLFKSQKNGAQTSIYVSVAEELQNVTGKYFSDCRESSLSNKAQDVDKAKKLYELTEEILKLHVPHIPI